ncbi:MAG: gliding motility lipoprotein GldH [Flavobacteriales bacterium]|nr:gliding motility lipoprotein GldH [Flavobacteriales bacterium]
MKKPIQLVVLTLLLVSCSKEYFFFDSEELAPDGWKAGEAVEFELNSTDTSSYLDFYLDIRNNDDYPYRNIYVFIEMDFPNGRSLRDTVHFPSLATPDGRWTGKGIGSTFDNSILYKQGKKLPLPGDYVLRVEHAMRDTFLQGIERVGIHIESAGAN